MDLKDKIFGKRLSGILNFINIGLGLICLIYYSVKAMGVGEFNSQVDIYLVIAMACCGVYVFADHFAADIGNLAAVVFLTLTAGKLMVSSINTFADALNGISMFGSSGEIGHIIVSLAILIVMLLLEIVSCFLSRDKKAAVVKGG